MLLQALDVALDRLSNIFGCFGASFPLGDTTGQSGTRSYKHSVLILLQVNSVLHYPTFYQLASYLSPCSGIEDSIVELFGTAGGFFHRETTGAGAGRFAHFP